jgi:A/G-specific adenine glycosylase
MWPYFWHPCYHISTMPPLPTRHLVVPLLAWYDSVHTNRAMPWRLTRDPYAIWLSETMLQQTQVETVKPYYHRFLRQYPTIAHLAAAPLQEVLTLWAGLGYYRRARHLHQAAQQLVSDHAGQLPADADLLQTLPGVGRYTAGAVASIAFNLPTPVVDGNVARLLARLACYEADLAEPKNHAFLWQAATELHQNAAETLPNPRHGDLNQALMELGSTVCTPQNPSCLLCPLRAHCQAYAAGRQNELPVKSAKKATPVVRGTALIVLRPAANGPTGTEVLLVQRPGGGIWEHMWEFPILDPPAAKTLATASPPESPIGLPLEKIAKAGKITHQLTHRTLLYSILRCETSMAKNATSEHIKLLECNGTGATYLAAQWLPWPIPAASEVKIPIAKAVHKIAAAALASGE